MRISIAKPVLGREESEGVRRVLRSGTLTLGGETEAFEQEFARCMEVKHAVAVSSGTTALHLALLSLRIGPGDEVIVPAFSYAATATAVLHAGATPVFADIEDTFYGLDPGSVEAAMTKRTKAVIVAHLYGHPARLEPLLRVVRRHGLRLIEDCAQTCGARYGGRRVGGFGDAACFSFYPSKNMTTGEGGMVLAKRRSTAEALRSLRNHGADSRGLHVRLGYNFRMTEFQAAIGRAQIARLDAMNRSRRAVAREFDGGLASLEPPLVRPRVAPGATHTYSLYTLRAPPRIRDRLQAHLRSRGIDARVYYSRPIPRQPLFRRWGVGGRFPLAERCAREVLSLPAHPRVGDSERRYIVKEVRRFFQ